MRCTACNVDLCDEYTVCPLCGKMATDEDPVIKYFRNAPYPHSELTDKSDMPVIPRPGISKERLKAFFSR